jgi:nucleotide-binding universal stress UspA family protein
MSSSKILYATDYSPTSKHALPVAVALAKAQKATLLIAHVSDRELYPVGEACEEEPEPSPEEMAELKKVVPEESGVECEHRLIYAAPSSQNVHPAEEIIKLAKSDGVEMIVLGTHGRSGLQRILSGSVADQVLRQAPCTVVTVRHAEAT